MSNGEKHVACRSCDNEGIALDGGRTLPSNWTRVGKFGAPVCSPRCAEIELRRQGGRS